MNISKETEQALFEVVKIILSIPMMILNIIVATLASLAVICYLFRDIDFTLALFQHYFVAFYGFELKLVHIYLAITSLHLLSVICYRIYVYVDSYRKYSPYKETSSVMEKPNLKETLWLTIFGFGLVYFYSNLLLIISIVMICKHYYQSFKSEREITLQTDEK
ncbi:hypothetical protein RF542_05390 [Pseudomonas aeruginosa]